MGNTEATLNQVRKWLEPSEETLAAVKERRDNVLAVARTFPGALRTYRSGSIGHHTANDDTDADCGVVLDRRHYPELGPDGDNVGPSEIVEQMREWLREELKEQYPNIRFRVTKRAIKITFNEPLPGGTDPTADLVVALTRKEPQPGLWIPNRDRERWDASHPERHTELMRAEPGDLRRKRARVIRLVKGWNKGFSEPGLSGFNITALALECVAQEGTLAEAVADFFEYAASSLKQRLTKDPAHVAPSIKLLGDREVVVGRLEQAAKDMRHALGNDTDKEKVAAALANLYPKCPALSEESRARESLAEKLRMGVAPAFIGNNLTFPEPNSSARALKPTRAYGQLMNKYGKKRGGPWYGEGGRRILFERAVGQHHPEFKAVTATQRKHAGRCYRLIVDVPTFEQRAVQILFEKSYPEIPQITADGPTQSPHRYSDGSLCIWYPLDDQENKWVFADGLNELVGHVTLHLFREAYWRMYGEWLGEEASHQS
jgi:hypothetical protein